MEALPIFLDSLVAALGAILISVTLILMFGEIIPQSVCTRHGLAIGAFMAPFVRVLVFICFPISYPISKLLDYLLGKDHVALFRRAELKTLVTMHGNEAGKGGELTHDETTIIAGALELTGKTTSDVMTPISSTFSIDINAQLNQALIDTILEKGHSRIPVYFGQPTNIIGIILVKNFLAIRPTDGLYVRDVTIRKIPRVADIMPLYDILNEFQKGQSHMAVVVKYSKEKFNRSRSKSLVRKLSSVRTQQRDAGSNLLQSKVSADLVVDIPDGDVSRPALQNGRSTLETRNDLRQGSSASNCIMSTSRSKKWKQNGSGDILKLDSEYTPSFPEDEEVVGIITMEDVIEELLQEEIFDETDVYINPSKLKAAMSMNGPSLLNLQTPLIQDIVEELPTSELNSQQGTTLRDSSPEASRSLH